ncbi:OLC1v1010280C1 [Oldenlandia corymbosa var. corymbosa]|uniref:OLC1v1010280C1 n=1 Tax=Oldenlandia corymbosa var. corymbosa TaxID=529605 RepID=A0AAV1DRK2_OLDCO|nr:OLC1v1010280C1 [Oldenlandia corymbosa var. corymbosa]
MGTCWPFTPIVVFVVFLALSISFKTANSDPQTKFIIQGCSQYNVTDINDFFINLNSSFADLRNQISQEKKHFATTNHPVYALFQCRNYLSNADCLSCYDTAVPKIRKCANANGARVLYDGCFLRYESTVFYDQTTQQGNAQTCSSKNASQPAIFQNQTQALLQDLLLATPRINGFYAASKRQLGNSNNSVYAMAQCAETVTPTGCQVCLRVAYGNMQGCIAKIEGRAYDAGCFMRYSATPFFADNQTTNIKPYLRAQGGSSIKTKAIIVGVVGGVGIFLLIILASLLWYQLYRKPKKIQKGNILGSTELQGPVVYSYKALKSATKDFSEENKLGEGGFGEVFKGTLANGNVVAVKKLSLSSDRVKAEFESEVRLISNVHHRNLVRLLGCADKGAELLLVYEYMANGSLDRYLYGKNKGYLNWKQRFNIIFDDDFQPKIADFGLAKLMPEDRSHLSTRFAGTLGYTAPEYATQGHLTEKVDTYSFGIVTLEIISGLRCNMKVEPESEFLLGQACKLYEIGEQLQLVDETMDPNDYDAAEVKKVIEIAMLCVQSQPSERPTMSEVVVMLSSDQSIEHRRLSSDSIDQKVYTSYSNATASFTVFTGR